jgi:general secretion pathway protein L
MNKVAMATFAAMAELSSRWIDSVANLACDLLERFSPSPTIRLVEINEGEFMFQSNQGEADSPLTAGSIRIADSELYHAKLAALKEALSGSQIELVLQSDRFIFRPLELPNRATEFLPGIVRSQIDRLTPWNPDDAAFGWSEPTLTDGEKLVVTVAATKLALVLPYVQAVAHFGAHSIATFAASPATGSDTVPIKVWQQKGRGAGNFALIHHALVIVLAAAGITGAVALGADSIVGASLSGQQNEFTRRLSDVRSLAGAARKSGPTSIALGRRELVRRKHDAPLTVLILETLSEILPDNTYLTDFRVDGNKLRLTGITHNAPSLIELIERSGRFKQATFFAPTTRSPTSSADHFSIEAIIKPLGPSS